MRLIRQLLVESGFLAGAGAVLGILLALWSKHSLLGFLPSDAAAFADQFELDSRMIGFIGAVSVIAAMLFGVLPAFRMTQVDLATALKDSAQNLSAAGSRLRLSNILVIAQVAVSLLVLVGAGLFLRTMWELRHVGVVKDSRVRDVRSETPSLLYMPFTQFPSTEEMKFAVKTTGNPASVVARIRSELESIDRNLVVDRVETARALVDGTVLQERSLAILTSIFGALGLLLAAIGLYGVMAYSISLRTVEVGIRMALGADRWIVLRMVMRQGLRLVAAGILAGLAGAFVLTRMIANQLFGVSAVDPLTLTGVSLCLAVVALIACFVPARRATRVDPLIALRHE
jgi:ABC-type antimicrobial peptide transport system permease subunit